LTNKKITTIIDGTEKYSNTTAELQKRQERFTVTTIHDGITT
jgi:hypothetical protein